MSEPHTSPHTEPESHSEELFTVAPAVSLAAIDCWERDLRAVLNYHEHDFLPAHLVHSVRRLRLLVGR